MGLGFSFLLWIKFIIGVEMSKSWYVLNSYSGYENKAKEQLLERITLNGMEDFFGKIEVPSEEITEMKGGKEKTIQKKFFPGYILVEMEMNDDTWHLVKETPRVLGFIGGTKTNPRPISENEDKSFDFIVKTTPASILLKKAAGLDKGSPTPNSLKVGKVTRAQVEEIAEKKMQDLNAADMDAAGVVLTMKSKLLSS